MPAIYSFATREIVTVTSEQYDLLNALSEAHGDLDLAFTKVPPISVDQLKAWQADPVFWPAVLGQVSMHARSTRLNADYLKDHLVAANDGKAAYTRAQMQAINASIKLLGLGATTRSAKIEATPDKLTVVFDEGLPTEQKQSSNQESASPDNIIVPDPQVHP